MDIKLKCDAISPCFCQKTYFDNNDTYDLIDGDYCVYCLVDYNKLYDEIESSTYNTKSILNAIKNVREALKDYE